MYWRPYTPRINGKMVRWFILTYLLTAVRVRVCGADTSVQAASLNTFGQQPIPTHPSALLYHITAISRWEWRLARASTETYMCHRAAEHTHSSNMIGWRHGERLLATDRDSNTRRSGERCSVAALEDPACTHKTWHLMNIDLFFFRFIVLVAYLRIQLDCIYTVTLTMNVRAGRYISVISIWR